MPVVGAITGGLDFSNYFMPLSGKVTAATLADAKKQGAVLAWGNFLTLMLNFIIVAWVMFLVVKGMNRMRAQQAAEPDTAPAPSRRGSAADGNPRRPDSLEADLSHWKI